MIKDKKLTDENNHHALKDSNDENYIFRKNELKTRFF